MRHFAEDMDRLFDEFGMRLPSFFGRGRELLRREVGLIPAEWSPRVEIREQGGQVLVRADLPGLAKDDIQVEMTHELLTIRGERKQEKKEEREGYAYSECSYGSFYRGHSAARGNRHVQGESGIPERGAPRSPRLPPRWPKTQTRRVEIQKRRSSRSSSVVSHSDAILSRTALARRTFSRMSCALAVQTNGLGSSLCSSI